MFLKSLWYVAEIASYHAATKSFIDCTKRFPEVKEKHNESHTFYEDITKVA